MKKSSLTSSVALCTCNGEKYVLDQLNSILNQSHPVDEIIVCDDVSADRTVDIIKTRLLKSNVNYKIIVNDNRLEVGFNFQKCISLCHGDIVFLSDQDDIWKENKVSSFLEAFQDKNIVLAFSDAQIINVNGEVEQKSLLSKKFDHDYFQSALTYKFLPDTIARIQKSPNGCLAAIRREAFLSVLDDPMCSWHDAYLFYTAALFGEYAYINEKLIFYRIHSNNLTSSKSKQNEYLKKIEKFDKYDQYFGLHLFRANRIELFRHIININNIENEYTNAYKKAINCYDSFVEMKNLNKFNQIIKLFKMLVNGIYIYRYYDPFKPNGFRFCIKIMHIFFNDLIFLMKGNYKNTCH